MTLVDVGAVSVVGVVGAGIMGAGIAEVTTRQRLRTPGGRASRARWPVRWTAGGCRPTSGTPCSSG